MQAGALETAAFKLTAAAARVPLAGADYPETEVWSYNGGLPGPEIRVRQGDRVAVDVTNRLSEPTTVHWHGIRIANAMDGVPGLTQAPIAPGERFHYAFDVPDAGTFWYHSHVNSSEQVGRGLSGPLIVEEHEAPEVDRDVTWVLDDWRLTAEAAIAGGFDHPMDMSHAGRLGNTVTVNGRVREEFAVRRGERLRLRLINVANARVFALNFQGHTPWIVALDGQPVEPHPAEAGRVVLGPAMRADLVIDMTGAPGERFEIVDDFYARQRYRLIDLAYAAQPLREEALEAPPAALPANPLAEPDLTDAGRHRVVFTGGMMGGMAGGMTADGWLDARALFRKGKFWAVNEIVGEGGRLPPLFSLTEGRSYVFELVNDSAWHHPIHLHGMSFRLLSRNGEPVWRQPWMDTVLLAPQEKAEVAFVADNPGDWMFHCHIPAHMKGGMTAVIRVREKERA
ncbi:MAG: multicopper oxidase family protein [Rhodovibrionaceae bacterium]|nr:multicopper oxidase family protein [Rhodovibrionaceae bacterium]